ncbi:MAG: hypothetical protein J7K81_09050 [Methanophagales archaeon]|nr:hypothetical protein [Methanophagales archaeon]
MPGRNKYMPEWEEDDPGKVQEYIQNLLDDLGPEFFRTEHFNRLPDDQKRHAQFVIDSFAEYMYLYHDEKPDEWTADGVEECCTDTLVRKISADEAFYTSLYPVLSAFFTFCEEKGLINNSDELSSRLKEIENEAIDRAKDPGNWGPAKSLFMGAERAGVDVLDQAEMMGYVVKKNLETLSSHMLEEKNVKKKKRKKRVKGRRE